MNNKNYQQIFNREIQNMDRLHVIDRTNKIISDSFQTAQGITQLAGGIASGDAISAVSGGINAAAAGTKLVTNITQGNKKHNEQRSFKSDMFNYELGNVQAIPNALAKNTAFTFNNKLFPFIEFYSCTDVEKEAIKEKIKYNSMTVMKVGTIGQYMNYTEQFIKGQIIRLPDVIDDAHIANEIYNEINKGVFIYG